MADLAKLLAESRAKREKGDGIQTAAASCAGMGGLSGDTAGVGSQQSDHADESTLRPKSAGSAPPKGNPFARKAAAQGAQSPQGESVPQPTPAPSEAEDRPSVQSRPRLAGLRFGANKVPLVTDQATGVAATEGDIQSVRAPDDLNLDSLADLESLEDPGKAPRPTHSGFADETPATAPTRTLPEGLEKQQLQFVDLIDGVYSILDDPELMGNVIKSIMIELRAQPQYMKLIAPDDIRLWIRGMRNHMGLARVKKTEAKAKRANGSSKSSKAIDPDMMADLADMGIGDLG